ncbi:universal stress protein [Raineyella fluvialis]|uniref:Universal stress protein n=1 Tax=Raineyella fluvialis TaxID=2662261 RepID=A0A5Q2FCQ6_9ACTN|nr:universal stress protein [Raineyella fluvialis]QGF22873.1 universal stress protein [Raineyella fluvialis]
MRVLLWIAPGTWPAVVDAARERPESDVITLIVADDPSDSVPTGALGGLIGRHRREPEPEVADLTADEGRALLEQAASALGRTCATRLVSGPTERVITAAAADADWLIVARDGDRAHLGPHSLGRHARFIIDHAPCTVQLIWPDSIPDLGTIPPPPR